MSQLLSEHIYPSGQRLQIVQGDLTEESVDAIVNAANSQLQHGGGVAAAIARRGGPEIQAKSNDWVREHGPVTYSVPAVTTGGKLPCSYVIHAVGPVWGEGDEDNKLRAAITGSLRVADQMELTTIAFPAISTGIFGFPKERAARVILSAIQEYLLGDPVSHILVVRMTLFDKPTIDAFLTAWKEMGLREME